MQENLRGVLPSQEIKNLINNNSVTTLDKEISVKQIQPSSLDLTLSDKAWRIGASFLPGKNRKVEQILSDVSMYELNLDRTTILEKGCLYLVKLNEKLKNVYLKFGLDLEKNQGNDSWELPVPATYVIDKEGNIVYSFLNVDYVQRAEPKDIIDALEALK